MRPLSTIALSALLVTAVGGCKDFLQGPGLGASDPNNITRLTQPGPMYVALEASQSNQFESQMARNAVMYVQQIGGAARQQQAWDLYNITSSDIDPVFAQVYAPLVTPNGSFGGGGAADARRMQTIARGLGDSLYIGIAKVWEALIIGEAASVWGDIPYSQAFTFAQYSTPKFDAQTQVYANVETQLDSAITVYLTATGPTNLGPTGGTRNDELIYIGQPPATLATIYTEVAHTLKARFYMHLAAADPSNYAKALAEAASGISTTAHDWNWFHASAPSSQNTWAQFQSSRTGDIAPGAAMVNLMRARLNAGIDTDTDRINFYFTDGNGAACGASCTGIRPGNDAALPGGGGNSGFGWMNATTFVGLAQPEVTFAENQLIRAEAAYQVAGGGAAGVAAAQPYFNMVRDNEAYGAVTTGTPLAFHPQPHVPATLQNIMEEKYIDQFLNIEAWNDYKRTCMPFLAPAPTSSTSSTLNGVIPGRLPYGQTELNTNPNAPKVSATGFNADTPRQCPALNYTTSTPLAY